MNLRSLIPALAVVLSAAWCTANAGAESVSPSVRQPLTIAFGTHLKTGPLVLTGGSVRRAVAFHVSRGWNPGPDSTLHLFVEHSPDLDPQRSFLSIALNYGIVRSVRLDLQNMRRSELVVPIPPGLVKTENEIVFELEQHARQGSAVDGLWTAIGADSFLQLEGVRARARLDLSELPDPVVDPRSYAAQTLAVLLPERPSSETIEAIALLTAHVSRTVRPGGVHIVMAKSVRTQAPLLIVGTPDEQPQLALLQAGLPFAVSRLNGRTGLTPKSGPPLGPTEAIVGLWAGGGRDVLPVLYATGTSPAAVHRGAVRLLNAPTLSGAVARITDDVAPRRRRALREWKGFLPPRDSFTLADLHSMDLPIPPRSDAPLTVSLDAPPDARFLNYGHSLTLRFKIEPAHFTPDARLRIAWNTVTVGEYKVSEAFKGTIGSLAVSVPARALASRNVLALSWIDPTANASDVAAGWLLRDSDFYLPRYYQAELPDLALLQFHLYPFSLTSDLSDALVVLPDRVDADVFAALLELSAAFAKLAPDDRVAFRVKRVAEVTDEDLSQSHLVLLRANGSGQHPRRPAIQEMVSPWNSRRFVLAFSAASADELRQAVANGLSDTNLKRLAGDATQLTPAGPISYKVGQKQTVGESSYLTRLEAWLRTNWLALPVILTVASGLFLVAFRLALRYFSAGPPMPTRAEPQA